MVQDDEVARIRIAVRRELQWLLRRLVALAAALCGLVAGAVAMLAAVLVSPSQALFGIGLLVFVGSSWALLGISAAGLDSVDSFGGSAEGPDNE